MSAARLSTTLPYMATPGGEQPPLPGAALEPQLSTTEGLKFLMLDIISPGIIKHFLQDMW